ncbi:MAG: hypothetical protein PHZ24_14400 [Bacteroidales bacterium]|nr:hypothetical protein [Bacteroidales bacterium]
MKQSKIKWKIIAIVSVILLVITNFSWFYVASTNIANYCAIANEGRQMEPNWECKVTDVTKDKVTVFISVVQGTQYVGKFTIDRTTNKIIDKVEAN